MTVVSRSVLLAVCAVAVVNAPVDGAVSSSASARSVSAEGDWPTHRHDSRRSGVTSAKLKAPGMRTTWTWRSRSHPQTAWAGPAKWDAYARIKPLGAMRDYDLAFGIAVAGGRVFISSSADDSVHCLDAVTGKPKWTFTTDGPVRIAPTVVGDRVYFASDDGYAYCLRASKGGLVWRYSPKPDAMRLLQNGKLISPYPCRTGVLVEEGVAYFAAGLLPWREAYACAVDAATGAVRYCQQHRLTPEGPALLAGPRIIYPQGRISPVAIDRNSGKGAGRIGGGQGGTFALVTSGLRVYYGQTSRTSSMASDKGKKLIKGGRRMVVTDKVMYLARGDELIATDIASGKTIWTQKPGRADSLILAAGVLVMGGTDAVRAFEARSGRPVWAAGVDGRACGLAVAQGRLYASTSEGVIYCFGSGSGRSPARPQSRPQALPAGDGALALGPWVEFTGPSSAVVRWDGGRSQFAIAGRGMPARRVRGSRKKGCYEAKLSGLRRDVVYSYAFGGAANFELDTFFNYTLDGGESRSARSSANSMGAGSAKAALAMAPTDRGICVVVGNRIGGLAGAIARLSRFRVIGFETSASAARKSRTTLLNEGVYGSRVALYPVKSASALPCIGEFANLVVCTGARADEIARLVAPGYGVAVFGSGTRWRKWERPPIRGAGVWTHQYGSADNSAFGGEQLSGAKTTRDMRVQWIGRPGPRYQPDRNGRKPAPLAVNGRLFGQGLQRIVALDAFNGSILWSLEVPPLGRFNIPRDCGNWCADTDSLFAAVRDRCWVIDAGSGEVKQTVPVPSGSGRAGQNEWGYIADGGSVIIGSVVKKGSAFMEFWGGAKEGWYDATSGQVTFKLCSSALFAVDKKRWRRKWSWVGGAIINSTITIGDGSVFFVHSMHPKARQLGSGKIGIPELWQKQELVALDVATGKVKWKAPIDTADGTVMFSMAYGKGKLAIAASTSDKKYEVAVFDASGGKRLWTGSDGWPGGKGDHGKAMSRPAIVGDKLIVKPAVYDLASGRVLSMKMPAGTCGTYALTEGAAFFRSRTVTMWSFDSNAKSDWSRLRPSCWLSTVPALGLVLSPEGGGGCKCAGWLETSLVFIPRAAVAK